MKLLTSTMIGFKKKWLKNERGRTSKRVSSVKNEDVSHNDDVISFKSGPDDKTLNGEDMAHASASSDLT